MSRSIHARRSDRRGFATVLILMMLFMMLLLVITYLRTMRSYSLVHSQLAASSGPVLDQLKSDIALIIGADGKIGPSGRQNPQTQADIHEPYDYPWTNTRVNLNDCRLSYPRVMVSRNGMGDPLTDDSWLAPLEPDAAGTLCQVSNIAGSFLVYTNANLAGIPRDPTTRDFVPADAPAGVPIPNLANGQSVVFQNLAVADPRLVDVDGDGIGDALWFYPRNNLGGGLRYVAAVKVVDLSGCLNLNTALGELATAPGTQSGTPRKGEAPYEVDAGKLDPSLSLNATSKAFRYPGYTAASTDYDFWKQSGGQVGANGLAYAGASSVRYGLSDQIQLADLSDKLADGTTLSPAPKLFDATSNGNTGHYGAMLTGTAGTALRRRSTILSGAMDRAAPPPFSGSGSNASVSYNYYTGFTHRAGDLNLYQMDSAGNKNGQWWSNTIEDYFYFYGGAYPGMQELFQGVDSTTPNDDYPFPEGFKQLFAGSGRPASDMPREYQIQVGACLQDALERDNRPSMTWNWTGWKPLPIMTEFYAQMPYVVGAAYQIPWNTNSSWNATATTSAGWTPTAAVLVFPNTTIAQLSAGGMAQTNLRNLNLLNYDVPAQVFFCTYTAGSDITAQFQGIRPNWGSRTECWKIRFKDSAAGVTAELLYGKAMNAAVALGTDFDTMVSDAPPWRSDVKIGLPTAAGTNWNQGYINTVKNRTAVDASNPTPTAGQYSYGNPTTSTDWRATGIAGVGSYAFELANPYAVPIRLNNLRIRFRANERSDWSAISGLTAIPTAAPSADLSSFITAGTGLARDAEGYYVLKPGERIVFYRNGTEYSGPGGARRRPMGGPVYAGGVAPTPGTPADTDISPLITTGAGIYQVNLGTATSGALTAPDINGYPANWGCVATIELEVNCKNNAGANWGWLPYNHMVFQAPATGYDQNHSYQVETNVPDGYQAAPGDLVYLQQDVRTFGSEEKLNLLQARPACFPFADISKNIMPLDLGDTELRTNTYAAVGSGVLPNGSAKPYAASSATFSVFGGSYYGHQNTASTMPLGNPVSAMNYLSYDATSGTDRICALGQAAKVSFRTTPLGGPNRNNPIYGGDGTSGGRRQDIRDGSLFFNYVGIPGDADYPGTFPELAGSVGTPWTSAVTFPRDAAVTNSVNGQERRDGLAHTMDISRIMMAGPVWWNFSTGNYTYRGTTGNGGWGLAPNPTIPTIDQLTHWYEYTIGDAVNFYLAKDAQVANANGTTPAGLPGLCLRTDAPFYNPATIANPQIAGKSLDQLYQALADKQAQLDAVPGPPAPPAADPNAATRAAYNADLATIRAGIRGQMNWHLSWADVMANYFQVDSPKYKGNTGKNDLDFKPGTININTAPKEVLKCLSLPKGTYDPPLNPAVALNNPADASNAMDADAFAAGIVAARAGLPYSAAANYLVGTKVTYNNLVYKAQRSGTLAQPDTSCGVGLDWGACGPGMAVVAELGDQFPAAFFPSTVPLTSAATGAARLRQAVSWLPQQASCRSDVFCAYILLQGYVQDDFNKGPVDVRRAIVFYKRDVSGNAATILNTYIIPNN